MKTKRNIFRKLVCLTALFTMLIGSSLTTVAKEGVTTYWKADGIYTFVNDSQVPAVGTNGLPLYHKEYSKSVVEVSSITPGGIYIYGVWDDIYTPEQIALLYSVIDASGITNEMSKYDKAVALNNAECAVMDYNERMFCPYKDGIYILQMGAGGVCSEYADLYQTLCQAVGIDCQIVVGNIENGSAHGWNVVKIDGKEYYTDVTWNDGSNNAYLMREAPIHREWCRSGTEEADDFIYFPSEMRPYQNFTPADAARFTMNLADIPVVSEENMTDTDRAILQLMMQ